MSRELSGKTFTLCMIMWVVLLFPGILHRLPTAPSTTETLCVQWPGRCRVLLQSRVQTKGRVSAMT
jgi:hypothetical protein